MFNRRQVLAAGVISAASALTQTRLSATTPRLGNLLPIPELIDAGSKNGAVGLTIARRSHAFLPGQPAITYGYSAPVLGPVIRVSAGTDVGMTIENRMDQPTTVHWHGLLIPSDVDGGPHNTIAPGQTWRPVLRIGQPETTAWFHPHPHGDTARQVYSGLAGVMIVEDGTGERLGLPHTYGSDDLPIMLQDRSFGPDGALVYNPSPMDIMSGLRGNTIIVNGAIAPVARVPAGIVRLRLINGANARIFDLRFTDGRVFDVIASDGGYLTAPSPVRALTIAPGERYEVLVDFSDGQAVILETGPDNNAPMMGMMMRGGRQLDRVTRVMWFDVDASKQAAVKTIPAKLVELPAGDSSKAAARRQFALNDHMGMMGGMGMGRGSMGSVMSINGKPFDMNRIDVEAKLGTMELWDITSETMAHPFHVHGAQFRILSLDGQTPPPHQRGWKDTVLVPRTARLLVSLTQPAARKNPFMFHCHILEHEDAGMMGQYICT